MSYIVDQFAPRYTITNSVQSKQEQLLQEDRARESLKYNVVFDSFQMTVNPNTWNPATGQVTIPILGGMPWTYRVDLSTMPGWMSRNVGTLRLRKLQITICNDEADYNLDNPFCNYIFSMQIPVDNRYEFRTQDQRWVSSDLVNFGSAQYKGTIENTVDYGGFGEWNTNYKYWHLYEYESYVDEARIFIPGNMESTTLQFLKGHPADFVYIGNLTSYPPIGTQVVPTGGDAVLNTCVDLEFSFFD